MQPSSGQANAANVGEDELGFRCLQNTRNTKDHQRNLECDDRAQ